jgi:RHS repeat-associated protein
VLTATADQSISGTGWAIQIFDQGSNTRYANCVTGTTCTYTINWSNAGHGFVAYVGQQSSTKPPPELQATSNTVTVNRAAWTLALTTDKAELLNGETATLTATANQSVSGTGWAIQVFDTASNTRYANCVSGTTCTYTVDWGNAGHGFVAYVGQQSSTKPPPALQATSNTVTIAHAAWTLTLSSDRGALRNGETATVTATANQPVGGTGWAIQVFDQNANVRYANCVAGTTCTYTVNWSNAGHDFVAYVGQQSSTKPPPSLQATSNVVTVARVPWSVSLTTDASSLETGQTATLTATADQPVDGTGFTIQVFDVLTGTRLANCATGTTCTATAGWSAQPRDYIAYVAVQGVTFPPAGSQAESGTVRITPAPFFLFLDSSVGWIGTGVSVTLTAMANQSMAGSPYYLQIFDLTTGARVASCGVTITCQYMFVAGATAHTYGAFVAGSGSTAPPPDVQARSNVLQAPTTYDVEQALGESPNRPSAGDPVDVATGNFFDTSADLVFPATSPGLGFTRTYNSRDARSGALGRGWSSSYTSSVTVDAMGNGVLRGDDGATTTFAPSGSSFLAPAGFDGELAHLADSTWRVTYARGGDRRFDTSGALTRITAADGTYVTVTRVSGRVTSVASSTGRSMAFGYDLDGRLATVTANDGRSVAFGYIGALLTTATAVDGGVTTYAYDNGDRITTIVDGDGRTKVVNTYDLLGRVASQTTPHGQRLDFAYSDDATRSTTVTESATAAVTTYRFDAAARLIQVTDSTAHSAARSYGTTGHLAGTTDRRSSAVTYTFDANGNQTGSTTAAGTESATYDASNRLVSSTDAAGHTTTFSYTGADRTPTTITWPDLTTTTQAVVAGLVTSTTDADGVTRSFGYDAARNLVRVTDGLGRDTTMTYDSAGRLHTRTTPMGETTTWTYDPAGRVTSVTDPTGAVTTTAYDRDGNATSVTDANDHPTAYTYDNASQLTRVDLPDGTNTTYTYDDHGNRLTETLAGNATTTYTYGPLGRLATVTDPAGVTTTYDYDANGAVTTTADSAGHITTTSYDAAGQVVGVTDPLNRTTTYVRDALGRVTSTTDPAGGVTSTTYDSRGRVATTTDAVSRTTAYSYTPGGRLDHVTYPGGWTRRYTYDAAGRRVTDRDPELYDTTFAYDLDGRLGTVTTPQSLTTTYTYDGAGRVLTEAVPGHGTTVTTYTPTGKVATRTDATNGVVRFGYDPVDRLRTATDANGHVTTYGYDGRGNQTSVVDARGHTWSSSYDLADRLLATTDPLGHATTYAYDSLGRVSTVTDASGRSRTATYDAAGQVTRTTFGDGTHADYTYDGAGRMLTAADLGGTETMTYDPAGHLLSDGDGGRTVGYAYDVLGRVSVITYPDGSTATNHYDGTGKLMSVVRSDGATATYTYDADGRVLTETLPGATTRTYGYAAGLLATFTEARTGGTTTTTLTHDAAGRIATSTTGGGVTAYTYDPAGQLLGVDAPGTANDETFAYDPAGNITTSTAGGVVTARTYDDADRLMSSAAGGTTTAYTYDAAGRLTAASGGSVTTTDTYDARGRLGSTSRAGVGTMRVWARTYTPRDRLSRVDTTVTVVPALGLPSTTTTSTSFGWDTARTIPQVLSMTTGLVTSDIANGVGKAFVSVGAAPAAPFSRDALGNLLPTAATASLVTATAGYSAYGRPSTTPTTPVFGYGGELLIGSRIHLRARESDPSLARFTTRDPLEGTAGQPVATNPYHYAANDPVNAADPSGLNPGITDGDVVVHLVGAAGLAGAMTLDVEQAATFCVSLAEVPQPRFTSSGEFASACEMLVGARDLERLTELIVLAGITATAVEEALRESGSQSPQDQSPSPPPQPQPSPQPTATAPGTRTTSSDESALLLVQVQWTSRDSRYRPRGHFEEPVVAAFDTGVTVAQTIAALDAVLLSVNPRSALAKAGPAEAKARIWVRNRPPLGVPQGSKSFRFPLAGSTDARIDFESIRGPNLRLP